MTENIEAIHVNGTIIYIVVYMSTFNTLQCLKPMKSNYLTKLCYPLLVNDMYCSSAHYTKQ